MPTLIDLIRGQRSGSKELDQKSIRKTLQEKYLVLGDNLNQTQNEILATAGLPPLGSVVTTTNGVSVFVKSASVNEVDTVTYGGTLRGLWEVEYDYSSDFSSQSDQDKSQETTPENIVPTWSWSTDHDQVILTRDAKTKSPIVNPVDEPILVEVQKPMPVLTITRIQTTFDPLTIFKFCGKVNKTNFWTSLPGTVLCDDISDEEHDVAGLRRRKVTYKFKFKLEFLTAGNFNTFLQDTWILQQINIANSYYKTANTPASRTAFQIEGKPYQGFVNADGTKFTPANLTDPHPATDIYLYEEAEFNDLKLGPTVWF